MRRNKNITVVESTVPFPYTDWDGIIDFTQREDPDQSFVALCCALLDARTLEDRIYQSARTNVVDVPDLHETPYLTIEEVRRIVSVRVAEYLSQKLVSGVQIYEESYVGNTLLSKFRQSVLRSPALHYETLASGEERLSVPDSIRPFSIPLECIQAFASYVFRESAQNMLFGEEVGITLPSNMQRIAERLKDFTASEMETLVEKGQRLRDKAEKQFEELAEQYTDCKGNPSYGQFRQEHVILRERLTELMRDSHAENRQFAYFTGTNATRKFKVSLNATLTGVCPGKTFAESDPFKPYIPSLEYLMLWAVGTWKNHYVKPRGIDYFIANDYIQISGGASRKGTERNRIPIYVHKHDKKTEITDKNILRILSFCIALPDTLKTDFIGTIYGMSEKKA